MCLICRSYLPRGHKAWHVSVYCLQMLLCTEYFKSFNNKIFNPKGCSVTDRRGGVWIMKKSDLNASRTTSKKAREKEILDYVLVTITSVYS